MGSSENVVANGVIYVNV